MAVSKRLRFEILRRDGFQCRYCGAKAPDATLAVDHVTPKALGGTDDPTNLVTACRDCNTGKASVAPDAETVADVDREAVDWAKRMKQAIALLRDQQTAVADQVDQFGRWWQEFGDPIGCELGDGWINTITVFLDKGLDVDTMRVLAERSMLNTRVHYSQVWRYFCGCCWRFLDDAQKLAKELP